MTLEALMSVVPPPKRPRDSGSDRDWAEVETFLGTQLPTDYKEYIDLYGVGLLSNHIWVYNPFSNFPSLNLVVQVREILDTWRATRARFGEKECPYPLYPEPDGLLPWGHVDNGSELFWQTSGDPNTWTVVVSEGRGPEFEQFQESMTGFLVSLFGGKLMSDVLPRNIQRKRGKTRFMPLKEA